MTRKIIGKRLGEEVYIIQLDDEQGQIADFEQGILFPPHSLQSILAHGDWEEYTESDGALLTRVDTELEPDDEELEDTPQDVIDELGFDPKELKE